MADAPKKTYLPAKRRKPNIFLSPGLIDSRKQRIPIGRRGEPIEDVTDKIREKKTLMQRYR